MDLFTLSTLTAEQLAELKAGIANREAELKKAQDVKPSLEAAAKKSGYADLDAALIDLGYVKASEVPEKKKTGSRKPRNKITPEMTETIVAQLKAETKSTAEIAEEHGISKGSVDKIKKANKLTKERAKKA